MPLKCITWRTTRRANGSSAPLTTILVTCVSPKSISFLQWRSTSSGTPISSQASLIGSSPSFVDMLLPTVVVGMIASNILVFLLAMMTLNLPKSYVSSDFFFYATCTNFTHCYIGQGRERMEQLTQVRCIHTLSLSGIIHSVLSGLRHFEGRDRRLGQGDWSASVRTIQRIRD